MKSNLPSVEEVGGPLADSAFRPSKNFSSEDFFDRDHPYVELFDTLDALVRDYATVSSVVQSGGNVYHHLDYKIHFEVGKTIKVEPKKWGSNEIQLFEFPHLYFPHRRILIRYAYDTNKTFSLYRIETAGRLLFDARNIEEWDMDKFIKSKSHTMLAIENSYKDDEDDIGGLPLLKVLANYSNRLFQHIEDIFEQSIEEISSGLIKP